MTVPTEPHRPDPRGSTKKMSAEKVRLTPPAVPWKVPGRRPEGRDVCVGLAPTGAGPSGSQMTCVCRERRPAHSCSEA